MSKSLPIKDKKVINTLKKYYILKDNIRDLLFFLLSINTGLRINDLLELNVSDVKNKKELVIKSESGEKKIIPLSDELQKLLKKYTFSKLNTEPLFSSKYGKRLSRVSLFLLFKDVCKELNLNDNISISSFRKTFGYHYYLKYKDLSFLQWLYNQNSVSSTLKYIDIEENINLRFASIGL